MDNRDVSEVIIIGVNPQLISNQNIIALEVAMSVDAVRCGS